jgi:hypothetical protein
MPERHKAMTLLAAWCAMRFGELAELRRKDLDLKNGVIHVRRAVVRVDGATVVGTPKSDAGTRDVAIPPHLLPLLKAHVQEHVAFGKDALLFPAWMAATSPLRRSTARSRPGLRRDMASTVPAWPLDAPTCPARPAAYRGRPGGLYGRDAGRADGPARPLNARCGVALPARRRRSGHGYREGAVGTSGR